MQICWAYDVNSFSQLNQCISHAAAFCKHKQTNKQTNHISFVLLKSDRFQSFLTFFLTCSWPKIKWYFHFYGLRNCIVSPSLFYFVFTYLCCSHFPWFEVMNCIFCFFPPQQTSTGEERLRMCVAVKKKLQLYYWKDREFHELQVN